ncbi:hypothetical protein PMAYCL1PPCAC_26565, partial [Pristionchus mayeri]
MGGRRRMGVNEWVAPCDETLHAIQSRGLLNPPFLFMYCLYLLCLLIFTSPTSLPSTFLFLVVSKPPKPIIFATSSSMPAIDERSTGAAARGVLDRDRRLPSLSRSLRSLLSSRRRSSLSLSLRSSRFSLNLRFSGVLLLRRSRLLSRRVRSLSRSSLVSRPSLLSRLLLRSRRESRLGERERERRRRSTGLRLRLRAMAHCP